MAKIKPLDQIRTCKPEGMESARAGAPISSIAPGPSMQSGGLARSFEKDGVSGPKPKSGPGSRSLADVGEVADAHPVVADTIEIAGKALWLTTIGLGAFVATGGIMLAFAGASLSIAASVGTSLGLWALPGAALSVVAGKLVHALGYRIMDASDRM